MKVYTKTGDKGTTSLLGGKRVSKADLRLETYGTMDEVMSWLGVLIDQSVFQEKRALLREIQDRIFTVNSHLASDPEGSFKILPDLKESDVTLLEKEMDAMTAELPPLKHFVLPGGHPANSYAHVARTVCRRGERQLVALNHESPVDDLVLKYVNRLSDLLFILSRYASFKLQIEEIPWIPRTES